MPTQLVVFDLDETITRHDTLLPYAISFVARRKPWRLPLLATVVPSTVGFVNRAQRRRTGERVFHQSDSRRQQPLRH